MPSPIPVLVTGGCGYIGSFVAQALDSLSDEFEVWIIDTCPKGGSQWAQHKFGGRIFDCDIRDTSKVEDIMRSHKIQLVAHLAALSIVPVSNTQPLEYYDCNVAGMISILNAMQHVGCKGLVFASSASVYGQPEDVTGIPDPLSEEDKLDPASVYGKTKMLCEIIARDCLRGKAGFCSLRLFNAIGGGGEHGEEHFPETHVVPRLIKSACEGKPFYITGVGFPTRDGTCIRDYVHCADIAQAFVLSLRKVHREEGTFSECLNIGGGSEGLSVRELVTKLTKVLEEHGINPVIEHGPRRDGDPPYLVASIEKAKETLGWVPRHTIDDALRSAVEWHLRQCKGD